jgi:hypothetical protein
LVEEQIAALELRISLERGRNPSSTHEAEDPVGLSKAECRPRVVLRRLAGHEQNLAVLALRAVEQRPVGGEIVLPLATLQQCHRTPLTERRHETVADRSQRLCRVERYQRDRRRSPALQRAESPACL